MSREPSAATETLADEAIEQLINDRRIDAARAAIATRLAAAPDDADAYFYRGACAMVDKSLGAARDDFATATRLQPREARFHAAVAAAALAAGEAELALPHSEAALAVAPDDLAALVTHIRVLHRLNKIADALPLANRLNELAHGLPESRALMADTLRRLGQLPDAIHWYQAARELDPANPDFVVALAACLGHLANWPEARRLVLELLDSVAQTAEELAHLGIKAQEYGSPHLALLCFKQGFSLFPTDITLCVNLGITVQGLGNPTESLYYLQQALKQDEKCAEAWFYSGACYQGLRQEEKAIDCFERCLEHEPNHPQALTHLAGLKKERGQGDAAKDLLRRAIEHNSDQWLQPYLNLVHFLQESGEFEEAEEVLAKAEAIEPEAESVRQTKASLRLKRGDIAGANQLYRQILERQPEHPDAMSGLLFCSNYDPELAPERIAQAYMDWDRRFVRGLAPPADHRYTNASDTERRLKVGYVSGDFRGHSVAFFSEPLLANHNHADFEIYCYANQRGGDAVTGRMLGMADHWRWIYNLSDEAVCEMIRMDGIDILVDLSNHTAYHRLYTFARKPAPIQMTTIGMPTTTGLSAIDWRITDAMMDPEGLTESLHSEKLLRIVSGWCYRPSDDAKDLPVSELPALAKGHLTLASFNAFGKINRRVIALWGRILRAIPDAVLIVATGGKEDDEPLNAQVRDTCAACDVPLERLQLMTRKPLHEYFEFHWEVDLVLDAFPYTGATVTAHALWMGVPVVTLAGPSSIHRSATSMLTSVGLPEFIATTEDEYLEIVRHWAGRVDKLAQIRRNLRPTMQKSPLMDGALVTADLEQAYRRVWREWCTDQVARDTQKETEDEQEKEPDAA